MVAYWSDVILSCRFVVAILSFCRLFLGEQLFLWGISAVAAAFKNKKNAVKAIFCFYGRRHLGKIPTLIQPRFHLDEL